MREMRKALGIGLPTAVLLATSLLAFAWLARRGFEVTDEAFYLLHLQHWRKTEAAVGFYGLYFEWLLRGVGGDVAYVRIAGWVVLVASAAYATGEVLGYCSRDVVATRWPFQLAGAAFSLSYYSYLSTLRVPSYNLAVLVFALLATAVLLRAHRLPEDETGWSRAALPVTYGAAVTACAISKPTAGLLLAPLHLMFLLASGRGWRLAGSWRFLGWSLLGAVLSLAGLQLANPGWPTVVSSGLHMLAAYGSHGDGVGSLARLLVWQVRQLLVAGAPAAAVLGLVYLCLTVLARQLRVHRLGAAELLAIGAVVWFVLGISDREAWWLVAVVAVGAMLLQMSKEVDPAVGTSVEPPVRLLPCLGMLMCTPFALSFGTNNSIATHASINAVFAGMALLVCLHGLYRRGCLGGPAVAVALALLSVPGVFPQWRSSVDAGATFRLASPLAAQVHRVKVGLGGHELLVDETTRTTLDSLLSTAHAAGWKPGEAMLDLTGDGPGWVYALGATPFGVPWLLGGYPGSSLAARQLVTRIDADRLREAWLLTSEDNPRRIKEWQTILEGKVGRGSHVPAGSVLVHSGYRTYREPRDNWTLRLWKPAQAAISPEGGASPNAPGQ
jgi:hypothetical protein